MLRPGSFAVLLVAFVLAMGLGHLGRRAFARLRLPPRRARPPALEDANRAWERRDLEALSAALERAVPQSREDAAETALLLALRADDPAAIESAGRLHRGTHAAARAAWELVRRAGSEKERVLRRTAFARAFPNAWVLAVPGRRAGP